MTDKEYFRDRRTIRNYTDRPISDETLREIIEDATYAPTTGNMQLYSVVVTRETEMKRRLSPTHFGQPQLMGAPVVLTVCADFNRFVRWCQLRGAEPGYDNLQSFVTALLDATIFAQQICTVAEMRGLGCCYLGTTLYNAPDIAEILRLPSRVVPVVTLTLGYPADNGVEVGRLPVDAIIHNEVYKDYCNEDIDRLFGEKEAREDSLRFVEENGKQTLAQVFTDVRYPKANNEHFSTVLADYLRKAYPGL